MNNLDQLEDAETRRAIVQFVEGILPENCNFVLMIYDVANRKGASVGTMPPEETIMCAQKMIDNMEDGRHVKFKKRQ